MESVLRAFCVLACLAAAAAPAWGASPAKLQVVANDLNNPRKISVGKDGVLTPRANVEPIRLCGTTVKRASLHNAAQLEQKDIRVGDTVLMTKANETPAIDSVRITVTD